MSARAWWPGIEAGDPAPGDPAALASLVAFLGEVSDGAASAARQLAGAERALDDLVWSGTAAHAFRAHQAQTGPRLHLVTTSYSRAAEALNTFLRGPGGLVDSQSRARTAEARARAAREHMASFVLRQHRAIDTLAEVQRAADAPATAQWQQIVASCETEIGDARRTIAQAREECARVADGLTARARTAAAALDDASRSGDYRSTIGWFERYVVPKLALTSRLATDISAVAGVASMMTLWCPALSGALATIALVSGLVAITCDVIVQSAAPAEGKGWRSIGVETATTAGGGAAKVFRSVALAGRTARGGRLVQSFAGLPANTKLKVGRELRPSRIPTMEKLTARLGLAGRGRTYTYRGAALPRQPLVAGTRRFARESAVELGVALRPRRAWQQVSFDLARRQHHDDVAFPRASYRTWAVLDGASTTSTLMPIVRWTGRKIRRTPPLRAATASR